MRLPPYHWWRTVFFLIPAIAVYTIVLGTLSLTSSLFQKTGYFAHWCARTWSRLILVTTGVRVDVEGLERLARDRTYVFVANHQSIYDIPILFWSLPYQLRIIAKESLGNFPFLGWHLRRTGHMLVDRRRPDRTRIFGWASRLTADGLCLILFPEGTRSRDGRVARFKGGSFFLALEAGLPVVPISVVGSRHVMLRDRLATYPGHVKLIVHEPIETTDLTGADAREFAERVRRVIVPAAESDMHVAPPDQAPSSAVEALRRA
ncbi:MAG TPA: lysophospholipid acyltransferase family protein [Vicinamibacterales bacterium]|nr:lysophospholipid acyltransferase family protein [Vicinamibacterales bacterium]